jgi:hypothetical protein
VTPPAAMDGSGAEFYPMGHGEDVWMSRLMNRTRRGSGVKDRKGSAEIKE